MALMSTTAELRRAGVPLVEAALIALRPPEYLVRADGTPMRRVGGVYAMHPSYWYMERPLGYEDRERKPDGVMLVACGACGARGEEKDTNAVPLGLFGEPGGHADCARCGAVLCRHGAFA